MLDYFYRIINLSCIINNCHLNIMLDAVQLIGLNINHFSSSTYIRDYQYSRKFELVVYDVNGNFLSKTVKFIVECSRCWES